MAAAQAAARHVHREVPIRLCHALGGDDASLAELAEAQRLKVLKLFV